MVKALYFKGFNFHSVKDKELYYELRTRLPQRAVLVLSFIGGSIVEILTDAPFLDRTKATLQQMGLTCVNYDPLQDSLKKVRNISDQERIIRNRRAVIRRARFCAFYTAELHTRQWYRSLAAKAQEKLNAAEAP